MASRTPWPSETVQDRQRLEYFWQLNEWQRGEAIRQMARDGLGIGSISEVTGVASVVIERILAGKGT